MLLEDGMIMVQNARLSYPNLVKPSRPKAYPDSPLMFSVDLVIPNTDTVVAETMQVITTQAQNHWKDHYAKVLEAISLDKKARSYSNGEEKMNSKTFERLSDRYPDETFVISAKAKEEEKPTMIRPDGTPVLANDEAGYMEVARGIYDGCRVNAIIRPWLRLANPGVSFRLIAIQFAGEDTRFTSASAPDVAGKFGAVSGPAPTMGGFTPPPAAPSTDASVPDFMKQS